MAVPESMMIPPFPEASIAKSDREGLASYAHSAESDVVDRVELR
jgi:hypothetical protein